MLGAKLALRGWAGPLDTANKPDVSTLFQQCTRMTGTFPLLEIDAGL